MKPGSSEFGLVVGIVLFVLIVLGFVLFAGDPQPCIDAMCAGVR